MEYTSSCLFGWGGGELMALSFCWGLGSVRRFFRSFGKVQVVA